MSAKPGFALMAERVDHDRVGRDVEAIQRHASRFSSRDNELAKALFHGSADHGMFGEDPNGGNDLFGQGQRTCAAVLVPMVANDARHVEISSCGWSAHGYRSKCPV